MVPFELPPAFRAYAARGEDWATWIEHLPRQVGAVLAEWELIVEGEALHGQTAVILPVRAGRVSAVLKLAWPADEGQHEILGLQHWHGNGAVQLIRADPRRNAMLLERLRDTDLNG